MFPMFHSQHVLEYKTEKFYYTCTCSNHPTIIYPLTLIINHHVFSNVFTFQWTPWFICWFQVHLDEFLFSPPSSLFVCLPDRNQFKKYHFFLLFFYLSHRKWEFLFSMTPLFFFFFLVFHFTWNSFFDPFFICAVWSPFYDVGWLWLFPTGSFSFSL